MVGWWDGGQCMSGFRIHFLLNFKQKQCVHVVFKHAYKVLQFELVFMLGVSLDHVFGRVCVCVCARVCVCLSAANLVYWTH